MKLAIAEPTRPLSGSLPDPVMNRDTYEPVLESVRAELSEHGGLLPLLGQQREAIRDGAWDEASRIGRIIQAQRKTLLALRRHRSALLLLVVPAGQTSLSLRRLTHHFPEPMRPLVEAITGEVRRLGIQVRRRRQKNRALMGAGLRP